MFTPQRKAWSTVSFTPQRSGAGTSSNLINSGKGKAVAFDDDPPPPLGSLSETREKMVVGFDAGNFEDWKKFREAGLLDEAAMQRKDEEALIDKVSRLERQLFDYQHNMGLLLIEKKEWNSKFHELRQELIETREILKREQSSHLIALSEVGKREENLRKALATERQCVADLERALRAMQEEHAQVQCSSQTKLAEANALVGGIQEKSSVVDKRLHDAEAKLAEVNRKSGELEMKLRELEVRESLLQKESLSVATDRESFEAAFHKESEDLKEWEKILRQREKTLCEGRQNLSDREAKANEIEKNLKQKEMELEVLEKNIQSSNSLLREKEALISRRLADLDLEEKNADSLKGMLEKKEKELLAEELKLTAREREGMQKLLDEQKDMLHLKLRELELEMEQKQKSLNEEFSSKEKALKQREVEVNHREEKLRKEEQAVSKKADRIKEQNKEIEAKLKSLKEKEKTMKNNEKELEMEKRQLLADGESLEKLKVENENIIAHITQQKQQICDEREKLKVTEEERSEHCRLQSQLQQEIEKTRLQREFLIQEAENLKQERNMFEKEWEVLDEKRAELNREQSQIDVEKDKLRKLHHNEEERLKREKQAVQDHIKKELEKLELEKESFAELQRHEQQVVEDAKNKYTHMLQDFEMQRRNLDSEIQRKQEEKEKELDERRRIIQEEKERELNTINGLKDVIEKECEEVRSERHRLENERKEVEFNKKQLESYQREMHEDSKMLVELSRKIKKEREALVAERNHFFALVEKLRGCEGCGEVIRDLVVSDLQLPECEEREVVPPPTSPVLDDRPLKNSQCDTAASDSNFPGSIGPMSWLRKCTSKIFNLSPNKRMDAVSASVMAGSSLLSDVKANAGKTEGPTSFVNVEEVRGILEEPRRSGGISHLTDIRNFQSDNILREVDDGYALSKDDHSNMDSLVEGGLEDSQQSVPKGVRRKPGRKRKSGMIRTRSVKAVVEDAKEFLGKASEEIENAKVPSMDIDHIKEDSREDSSRTEKTIGNTGRKRQRARTSRITESEQDAGESEGHSDSVTAADRRKKRQTIAPPVQVTGEKRYNLRRHKTAGKVPSVQGLSSGSKAVEKEATSGKLEMGRSPGAVSGPSSVVADDNVQAICQIQVSTIKNVEFSDDRVVRFEIPRDVVDDNGDATKSVEQVELSDEVNGTLEYRDENEGTTHEVENDYEEEEEEEHPGEVSIGKKIFKFFTT